MINEISPYIPLTALNTVWRKIHKKTKTIIDAGCGKGEPMQFINRNLSFYSIGIDIFKPYVKQCKKHYTHDDYVVCSAACLPFKEKSFDTSVCMNVLEHLERPNGITLIAALEKVSRNEVIITSPVGRNNRHPYEGNPYQEHKWIWMPNELKLLGYTVRGIGLRNLGGEDGLINRMPLFLKPSVIALQVLSSMITYFIPVLSGRMICYKKLNNKSRNDE